MGRINPPTHGIFSHANKVRIFIHSVEKVKINKATKTGEVEPFYALPNLAFEGSTG